jgi:hypothetical protein
MPPSPTRKALTVSVQIKSHYPGQAGQELVQIDDLQLFRQMPKGWGEKVVPLCPPGGLVKYPIGKGGIVLNRLDMNEMPADAKAGHSRPSRGSSLPGRPAQRPGSPRP